MTEHKRNSAKQGTLGFISDDLEGEECVECGAQATVAYETPDDPHYGMVHYCAAHDPNRSGKDQVVSIYPEHPGWSVYRGVVWVSQHETIEDAEASVCTCGTIAAHDPRMHAQHCDRYRFEASTR